ncbi:MAG: hypothetical protein IT266_12055 [Saprospiraceae bacterium]|nr:hypothetical protein [Saprospiraceae bacterium]
MQPDTCMALTGRSQLLKHFQGICEMVDQEAICRASCHLTEEYMLWEDLPLACFVVERSGFSIFGPKFHQNGFKVTSAKWSWPDGSGGFVCATR